jgi:hypothetical protein
MIETWAKVRGRCSDRGDRERDSHRGKHQVKPKATDEDTQPRVQYDSVFFVFQSRRYPRITVRLCLTCQAPLSNSERQSMPKNHSTCVASD